MRVAFVPAARLLSDRRANGEALIAEGILRRLAARGHELLAYVEHADMEHPIEGLEIVEVSAEAPTAAMSRLRFARRIAQDAARRRFDVAHLLFPFSTQEGYTLVRGAPLVAGPIFVAWPSGVQQGRRLAARAAGAVFDRREARLHKRTLHRADRLLVTGARARAALASDLHDRVVDVPLGVDTDRFAASPLPEEPVILFLSVLQPRKGAEVLLRAMPWVLQEIPRARLVVAGDDPFDMTPALRAIAEELRITPAVEFTGAVSPFDAPAVHRRARVFCQPSLGEPFGMTVLEAMATGRPVVATAAGGVTDIVADGRGGLLAQPGDPRLLADAIISVLRYPERTSEMGAFNRARAERRFSLEQVVDRIELTYDALAKRTPTGGEIRAS